jgi:hypothetical protein
MEQTQRKGHSAADRARACRARRKERHLLALDRCRDLDLLARVLGDAITREDYPAITCHQRELLSLARHLRELVAGL